MEKPLPNRIKQIVIH